MVTLTSGPPDDAQRRHRRTGSFDFLAAADGTVYVIQLRTEVPAPACRRTVSEADDDRPVT